MIEHAKPIARAVLYGWRYRSAQVRAHMPYLGRARGQDCLFIVGCGRSGTTVLGELLSTHPDARYLFEPYHLWAALDPDVDFLHLYARGSARTVLRSADCDGVGQARFRRLFGPWDGRILIEKTPINALRTDYLQALAPGCRFVHIVRNGIDVASSIERVASEDSYRMAFRAGMNTWWGVDDVKWRSLVRDAAAIAPTLDASDVRTHFERGAFEWIISLLAMERAVETMPERILEVGYQELAESPASVLRSICELGRLNCVQAWLDSASAVMRPAREYSREDVVLPAALVAEFNRLQAKRGFSGRAAARAL